MSIKRLYVAIVDPHVRSTAGPSAVRYGVVVRGDEDKLEGVDPLRVILVTGYDDDLGGAAATRPALARELPSETASPVVG